MMTKVFGEGVTYTEEPPEGDEAAGDPAANQGDNA